MNNNEIRLKTRKQLLFVQCFPLFWSPVFPCFACTVNMRLGSCCSVGENSCKSWQEVGKNTRVSLFHCFIVSSHHLLNRFLFHGWLSHCFPFMHLSYILCPCPWRTYYAFPLFACLIIFHYRLILFAPACCVVWSKVSTILWFSLFFRKASNVSQKTRKTQWNVSFCKIFSQVELSWQGSLLKRQILYTVINFDAT